MSKVDDFLDSEFITKIKKKHGASLIMKASQCSTLKIPRIPTGIFALDYALGGGFPVGRISMVYGHKSVSKTSTILRAIANAQNLCSNCWSEVLDYSTGEVRCACGNFSEPICVYLDVEGSLDLQWAADIGVNLDKLILSVPEYAEQALDIGEAFIRNGCDVLALDSLAFLTPYKEIEESVGKDLVGGQARIIGRGVRKFVAAMNEVGNLNYGKRPTILTTNQIRMKVGVMFGSPETVSGGLSSGFVNSTETKMWAGKYEMDNERHVPLSVEMNFRVEKNKVASAKMEGSYKLLLNDTSTKKKGSVYDEDVIIKLCKKVGMLEKVDSSKWILLGREFNTKVSIEEELIKNPTYKRFVCKSLLESLWA